MTDQAQILPITPSQTIGPFFAFALTPKDYGVPELVTNRLVPDSATTIRIEGRVLDGENNIVPDAMLEIWQADARGVFVSPKSPPANHGFTGFARCATGPDGSFSFITEKPGRTKSATGNMAAPHVSLTIFARGLTKQLCTRIYFGDEAANADDPVLALVPPDRRATLIASKVAGEPVYRLDLRLQGEGETVFFDI